MECLGFEHGSVPSQTGEIPGANDERYTLRVQAMRLDMASRALFRDVTTCGESIP